MADNPQVLRIKTADDIIIEINFNNQLTLLQVKEELGRRETVEISRIRLMASGSELEDNHTLEHYNITPDQTLTYVLRPEAKTSVTTDNATTDNPPENASLLRRKQSLDLARSTIATGVGLGLCLLLCSMATASAVDIAAVVIGHGRKLKSYCDYTSSQKHILDPNLYLIIGGWIGIGTLIISTCFLLKTLPRMIREIAETPNATAEDMNRVMLQSFGPMTRVGTLINLFYLAWGIIGCIMYSKFHHSCKFTPVGKMVIAFAIIRLVGGCCSVCSSGRHVRLER